MNELSLTKKEIVKQLLYILPGSLLIKSIYIIDQIFNLKLGGEYLYAHSALMYVPSFLLVVGRLIGSIALVSLSSSSKESDEFRVKIVNQVLTFCLWAACLVLILLVPFGEIVLNIFEIPSTMNHWIYYVVLLLSSCLLLFSTALNFILISRGDNKELLIADLVLFCVNLFGNVVAYSLSDDSLRYIGLSVSTLVSSVMCVAVQLFMTKIYTTYKVESIKDFYIKLKKIFDGETVLSFCYVVTIPIVFYIIGKIDDKNLSSMFSIAENIINFILMPVILLRLVGVRFLSEILDTDKSDYDHIRKFLLKLILSYSGFLLFVLLLVPDSYIAGVLDIYEISDVHFLKLAIFSCLFLAISYYQIIVFTSKKQYKSLMKLDLFRLVFSIATVLFLYALDIQNKLVISLFVFTLPQLVYIMMAKMEQK